MNQLYGKFSKEQLLMNSKIMHSEVHKLLLFKDKYVTQTIFDNEEDFLSYFSSLLRRFGGLNELLFCPVEMVALLATLQAAYDMVNSNDFNYCEYRKLIFDAHNYIKKMFEDKEVTCHL